MCPLLRKGPHTIDFLKQKFWKILRNTEPGLTTLELEKQKSSLIMAAEPEFEER